VMLVEFGVNMGDHAETVYRAQQVDPSETVGALAARLLAPVGWKRPVPDYSSRIEIRLAEPKLEPLPSAEPWRNDTTGSEPF